MELTKVYCTIIFWLTVILHSVMCLGAISNNSTILEDQNYSKHEHTWSSWGRWSPCSRTCGGGVAVQERHCLPKEISRSRTIPAGTLAPPVISVRITRQAPEDECAGEAKRYRECNTAPCTRGVSDPRAQQCAAYDRRPFRGRFYTWVPYVDGDYPCTLNCRPLGQLFYATLALVADGTPCTKPGFSAMCVQGVCKVHGARNC